MSREDTAWFQTNISATMKTHCAYDWEEVVTTERLMYGDYLIPGADPRVYTKISDLVALKKVVEESLEDFNSISNTPMKLVTPPL